VLCANLLLPEWDPSEKLNDVEDYGYEVNSQLGPDAQEDMLF